MAARPIINTEESVSTRKKRIAQKRDAKKFLKVVGHKIKKGDVVYFDASDERGVVRGLVRGLGLVEAVTDDPNVVGEDERKNWPEILAIDASPQYGKIYLQSDKCRLATAKEKLKWARLDVEKVFRDAVSDLVLRVPEEYHPKKEFDALNKKYPPEFQMIGVKPRPLPLEDVESVAPALVNGAREYLDYADELPDASKNHPSVLRVNSIHRSVSVIVDWFKKKGCPVKDSRLKPFMKEHDRVLSLRRVAMKKGVPIVAATQSQEQSVPVTSKVMNAHMERSPVPVDEGHLHRWDFRIVATDSECGGPVYVKHAMREASDSTSFVFSWTRDPHDAQRICDKPYAEELVAALGRRAAVVRPSRTHATRSDYDKIEAKIRLCEDAADYLLKLHQDAEKAPWSYVEVGDDFEELNEIQSSAYTDEDPVVCAQKSKRWPLTKDDAHAIVTGRNTLLETSMLLRAVATNYWSMGQDIRNAITNLAEKVMAQKERNES